MEQACRNAGASEPEVARQVVMEMLRAGEADVSVVRLVEHEGAKAVLLRAWDWLLTLGNGLDAGHDAYLYLIVACPACGALVSQGDFVLGRSTLRGLLEDPPDGVRYHRAEGSDDLKLLQSMTERLTYSGRSVGGTLCSGALRVGSAPTHPEVPTKRSAEAMIWDGGSDRGAKVGADLTAAGWRPSEIRDFFSAVGVLEGRGWRLMEPSESAGASTLQEGLAP